MLHNTTAGKATHHVTGVDLTGWTQAKPFPIPAQLAFVECATVPANGSVMLPNATPPAAVEIANDGANSVNVYPPTGGTVNGGSVNAAYALANGSSATFWASDGLTWHVKPVAAASGAGSGTVTSVGMAGDGVVFASSVGNSPVTSAGTLTPSLASHAANTVLAGPATGAAATPSFRGLVPADLPALVAAGASHAAGIVPDPGSTAHATPYLLGDDGAWHQVTGAGLSYAGGVFTISGGGGGGGGGTVTSVDMTVPSWMSVSGNPVTSAGTLALTAAGGQTANQVLATPNGASGALSPRSLVAADLPTVTYAKGGTGLTAAPTNGQVPIGNGSGYTLATLTAGANVTITPGAGSITIAASGGGGTSPAGVLVNGTALTNSTATTDLGSGGTTLSGTFTIAANRLAAGTIIRIRAGGVYTGNGAAGLGIKLYLDGATGTPVMVPASGGPTLPSVTALPWSLDAVLVCHATGATGSIGGMGVVRYTGASTGGTSDLNGSLKEYPTSGTPVTIDTTASHTISIIGAWNTASSAVSVQLTDFAWWIEG